MLDELLMNGDYEGSVLRDIKMARRKILNIVKEQERYQGELQDMINGLEESLILCGCESTQASE